MSGTQGRRKVRGNGEGSLYRRKSDGKWVGALSYLNDEGRRLRHVIYAGTQAEARAKLRAAAERLTAGAPVKDARVRVGAFIEDWIGKGLAASTRKATTQENYAFIARSHLIPAPFGEIPLDRLRPSDVEALLLVKRRAGKSSSTVRTIHSVCRAALDVAVRDGLLSRNPAAAIKRPAIERKDAAYLTREQVSVLLSACREDRLYPLFALMVGTGLRRGEALGLHWQDVDLDNGQVRVRWTLSRVQGALAVSEPKTDRSRRVVPLPAPVVDELRAHKARQAAERLAIGAAWRDLGAVFATEAGGYLEPRNVLRRFEQIASGAGLSGIGLHTLRHSAASALIEAGTHMRVLQELLGHSTFSVTADIYSHVGVTQQREAADRLATAFQW